MGLRFTRNLECNEGPPTSRRARSLSFCPSSYSYTGFTTVPGAGCVSSWVVLVI